MTIVTGCGTDGSICGTSAKPESLAVSAKQSSLFAICLWHQTAATGHFYCRFLCPPALWQLYRVAELMWLQQMSFYTQDEFVL